MRNRIFTILSKVFEVPIDSLSDTDSPDTIENWDSLRHMKMILVLEEQCGIIFTDQEIVETVTIEAVINTITKKLQNV